MAAAVEEILGDRIDRRRDRDQGRAPGRYETNPTCASAAIRCRMSAALQRLRRSLRSHKPPRRKISLSAAFPGGASALLPLPADGITLADKQETTRLLLASGATIHEINAVRKHLSAIKGGQLAAAAYPASRVVADSERCDRE